MHPMDIQHKPHLHGKAPNQTAHKTQRVYVREKVNGKWSYVPAGWMCTDCGAMLPD